MELTKGGSVPGTNVSGAPSNYWGALASGALPLELSGELKSGRNPDIDTGSVPEDIWTAGGVHQQLTTAQRIAFSSTSPLDTAAGTGMRSVIIFGLQSWSSLETFEIVELAGGSNAFTVESYVFVNRVFGVTWGTTNGVNAGDVKAEGETDGTTQALIRAGDNTALQSIYGFPAQIFCAVVNFYAVLNRQSSAGSADVRLLVKARADQSDASYVIGQHIGLANQGGPWDHELGPYAVLRGPGIVKVQAVEVSNNNTDISSGFRLMEYETSNLPVGVSWRGM